MFTIVDVYLMRTNFEIRQQEMICRANTERLIRQAVQADFVPDSHSLTQNLLKQYGKRLLQPLTGLMRHSS